ncbi:MAG: hypothetical protein PHZ19_05710 [Candidatus Thermoplasmatota archaeon]|nr:hypothetical protein [Candidatus Thermoplasmatota archaeon]
MNFTIPTPKPPFDTWPVLVDFSDRLDTAGGEIITGVSLTPYRLAGYDDILDTLDTDGAHRVVVSVERYGLASTVYSYRLYGQKTLRILSPVDYGGILDMTVVDMRPEQVLIAPDPNESGLTEPPATSVVFKIWKGVPGNSYTLRVAVITSKLNQHSCIVNWTVEDLR